MKFSTHAVVVPACGSLAAIPSAKGSVRNAKMNGPGCGSRRFDFTPSTLSS
jgi:hypothetical protein